MPERGLPRPRTAVPGRVCALLLSFASVAVAQTPPPNPGPDVIVGDLIDTQSYGSEFKPTGVNAYDIGTTSCNVGNVDLRWVASTNQHPVIAQNIYRLKDGRFEQVGLSWVKHGFFALAGNLCGTCNGNGGDVLGVGCSDPYDSGLNGLQSSLGPRSAINPVTGAFVYDSTTPGSWPPFSGSRLKRRVQVSAADIDPAQNPGALYFAEGVYISPDDAAAGNGSNNASYRAMRFVAGSPTLASQYLPGSTTQRTRPAIFAWRDFGGGTTPGGQGIADPGVRLVAIDVPGDGRFWLGSKVVALGDGTFRYEYAVYNLNSDRAAGSLLVPLPPSGSAAAAGSRTPAHHSGEPYSTSPWTTSIGATGVGFASPEPFATNVNAAALRWATLGSYWFTSPLPPGEGSVRLGLFKPGVGPLAAIEAVAVALQTPGGASVAPPAVFNDECGTPAPAHHGANGFSTLGATGDWTGLCGPSGATGDVWFSYTYTPYAPGCSGQIVFDTCGSGFGTFLEVYTTGACPTPGDAPACQDLAPPCGAGTSRVAVPAVAGRTYLVRVAAASGQGGSGVLNITAPFCLPPIGACCSESGVCTIGQGTCIVGTFLGPGTSCAPDPCPQPTPPSNDLCAAAEPIGDRLAGESRVSGRTFGALTDATDCFTSGFFDVWYLYTPLVGGPVTIDTCTDPLGDTPFDTILTVRASCGGPELGCNDDACLSRSRLTVSMQAGTAYRLRVAGFAGERGRFVIGVEGGGGRTLGACCRGAICLLESAATCAGAGIRFAGGGSVCSPMDPRQPCCRADFDQNGIRDVSDLFGFLSAWFAGGPSAAIGSQGLTGPVLGDIFVFLAAWFGGC